MRKGMSSGIRHHLAGRLRHPGARSALLALWLAAFAFLLVATNQGFLQRLQLLAGQERWVTLVGFLGVWGICVASLLIAAYQEKLWIRAGWAILFALSATVGVAFHVVSGGGMTVFDVVSLWAARHEAGRAAAFYGSELYWPALVLIGTLLVLVLRPRLESALTQRWLARMAFVPAVPVIAIAAITVVKEGGGTQALPVQYVPLSVGAVSGVKLYADAAPERRPVVREAGNPKVRHILVLVDESVRGDYVDLTPGNSATPRLAGFADRIVDFGHAVSGGDCSHYSNAILRFVADPADLGGSILKNPTIWQYAKRAGFETVYIDAQSAFNKKPGKLQNFMTTEETADIDRLYTMDTGIPAEELDGRLLDIVLDELASDTPKLIYANKNGAHFPYDESYPESERVFHPVMAEAAADTPASRINSYRNAVRWSVDRFFADFFSATDLRDGVLIYTSDHGQVFDPHALTHCSVEKPDPREGLVPLFVSTGKSELQARFARAAQSGLPRTHFAIMPTVLSLLGYSDADITHETVSTLLEPAHERTAFSSGDIFGLFSPEVRWHDVDPRQDYLEPQAVSRHASGSNWGTPHS
jgi:glucan phosphoethanolaminetransferase (alkaline phosphatase superfamily)